MFKYIHLFKKHWSSATKWVITFSLKINNFMDRLRETIQLIRKQVNSSFPKSGSDFFLSWASEMKKGKLWLIF